MAIVLPALGFFGNLMAFFRPYSAKGIAFKEIAASLETLAKSSDPVAYKEVYRRLERAYKAFRKTRLVNLIWYEETNKILEGFLENFDLIVLPETSKANMKREHLEQMALGIVSGDPSKIKAINELLESSYKKKEKLPKKPMLSWRMIWKSKLGGFLVSLCLGYGLVLMLCLIYVFTTQQDFMTFARTHPEIVVLGGLIVSGITFWKKD